MDVIMPCWIIDEELLLFTKNAVDSFAGHRLIIIDNGSPMGGGWMREVADLYVRNKTNLGYAKAVNQGLALGGETVAVANNDIRIPPNWADVAQEILNQGAGSVHFRMIPYNQPFNPGVDTWLSGKERWCTSSFFVMRNEIFYDDNYQNGVEDWDYWKRFREEVGSTAYTNKAEYQHADSSSTQRLPSHEENQRKNIDYFISKWGTTPEEDFETLYPGQLALPWKPMP